MFRIITFLFIILTVFACSTRNSKESGSSDRKNKVEFAKTLEIYEEDNFVRVHISNPESKLTLKYLLSSNSGIKIPTDYIFIKIPIKSIITLSSTHIGMLSKLDELDKITGVSNKKYIYNSEVRKGIASGDVKDFGDESNVSFESIVKSNSQILMYSGFGAEFAHTEQLLKLGTICIPNYDWKENHPLGKAEWIKFFGYLTGKQNIAESYFKNVIEEYNNLTKIALKAKTKPSVFSGNITGEIWYTPAGESFSARLLKDANCTYVYSDTKGVGSIELSFEKVLLDNKNTAFWFNPGFSPLTAIVEANPKMSYFKAVQNKNVFCYSPNMDKYWELAAVEPHHVLEDMIKILHPEILKDKQLHFYKNIGE